MNLSNKTNGEGCKRTQRNLSVNSKQVDEWANKQQITKVK